MELNPRAPRPIKITEPNKNPKGLIFTSEDQIMSKLKKHIFSLRELVTDDLLKGKLYPNSLPEIRIMDNGAMFFDSLVEINGMSGTTIHKWFFINSDFEITADRNFPFTQIFDNGYLMEIIINYVEDSNKITDFELGKVLNIENIAISNIANVLTPDAIYSDNYITDTEDVYGLISMQICPAGDEVVNDVFTDHGMTVTSDSIADINDTYPSLYTPEARIYQILADREYFISTYLIGCY